MNEPLARDEYLALERMSVLKWFFESLSESPCREWVPIFPDAADDARGEGLDRDPGFRVDAA